MHQDKEQQSRERLRSLAATLMMLAFGLAILAFLIAIDRPHWFHIRPASGTAVALSHAASSESGGGGDHRSAAANRPL